MLGRLILAVVTALAIGIGYQQYFGGNLVIFGQPCHRRFKHPFTYMATKTPYLSEELEVEAAQGDPLMPYHGGACQASMAWHLVRHGTRNPGSKVIQAMKNALPRLREQILEGHAKGKGKLCSEELEELKGWDIISLPSESEQKNLVPQGETELLGISRRFKQRFPHLYNKQYHNDTFKFAFTKTQRAEASAIHFTKGIFEDNHETKLENVYFPEAVRADPILRFYKQCRRWKQEVDKNPDAYAERVKFETSSIFKQMIRKLQERLGIEKPPSLEEVELIHLSCSFESAWNPQKTSPWCNLFDEHDFQLLEYRQDVEYYWIDGYGFKLTYEQACPTIEDIVTKFSSKIDDDSSPSVVAYFTHSGTLLKVFTRLGLFNDSIPLLGDNFDYHRSSRKWRTSVIDPFATNLAFLLYRCSNTYKVGLLFKERPTAQPLCDGKYLCPLNEFKSAMDPFIQNCDLAKMCEETHIKPSKTPALEYRKINDE